MYENGTEYLLDTAVFRGLSGKVFHSISKAVTLVASPYCFWELLRHLDEQEEFPGFKRRMMRFKKVWVLDRPWKEFEIAPETDDRIRDNDIIDAALAALEASEGVDDFYAKFIRDEDGSVRLLADCCERVRLFVRQGEEKFLTFVEEISGTIRASNDGYDTPEQQHRGVMSLIEGYLQALILSGPADVDREQIIHKIYFYHSYVFMLAIRHARTGRLPRANDFRDAEMCKHIAPGEGLCLVTDDKVLREGLQAGCELLGSRGIADLITEDIVISSKQFVRRVSAR